MANSNGIITEQVDISDISTVLGVASNAMSVLARHDNINTWAKNKPVFFAKEEALVENERLYQPGVSTFYGIKPVHVIARHPRDLYNAVVSNGGKGFIYSRPNGGDSSPYRMGDFSLYNHYARILFGTKDIHGKAYEQGAGGYIDLYLNFFTKKSGVEIDPNNFYHYTPNLWNNNMFLGVMAMSTSGAIWGWNIGGYESLNDKGEPIEKPADIVRLFERGEMLIFFFVANQFVGKWQTGDYNHDIHFYAIPNDLENPNPARISVSAYIPPLPQYTVTAWVDITPRGTGAKCDMVIEIRLQGSVSCLAATASVVIYNNLGKEMMTLTFSIPYLNSPSGGSYTHRETEVLEIPYNEIGDYKIGYPYTTQ